MELNNKKAPTKERSLFESIMLAFERPGASTREAIARFAEGALDVKDAKQNDFGDILTGDANTTPRDLRRRLGKAIDTDLIHDNEAVNIGFDFAADVATSPDGVYGLPAKAIKYYKLYEKFKALGKIGEVIEKSSFLNKLSDIADVPVGDLTKEMVTRGATGAGFGLATVDSDDSLSSGLAKVGGMVGVAALGPTVIKPVTKFADEKVSKAVDAGAEYLRGDDFKALRASGNNMTISNAKKVYLKSQEQASKNKREFISTHNEILDPYRKQLEGQGFKGAELEHEVDKVAITMGIGLSDTIKVRNQYVKNRVGHKVQSIKDSIDDFVGRSKSKDPEVVEDVMAELSYLKKETLTPEYIKKIRNQGTRMGNEVSFRNLEGMIKDPELYAVVHQLVTRNIDLMDRYRKTVYKKLGKPSHAKEHFFEPLYMHTTDLKQMGREARRNTISELRDHNVKKRNSSLVDTVGDLGKDGKKLVTNEEKLLIGAERYADLFADREL